MSVNNEARSKIVENVTSESTEKDRIDITKRCRPVPAALRSQYRLGIENEEPRRAPTKYWCSLGSACVWSALVRVRAAGDGEVAAPFPLIVPGN